MMIDDIKKVLALCVDSICDDCPYADTKDCYNQIKLDARDLVIKQESEIERLHQEVRDTDKMARNIIEQYKNGYNKAFERLKAQQQEIDRLKADNARLTTKLGQVLLSIDTVKEMNIMCNIAAQVKQAKIDVLNELKKKKSIAVWDIDEMIAEYENEG